MTRRQLFRMAMENEGATPAVATPAEDVKQPTIVMTGPLAEIYRKALDVAYAKQDTITGKPTVGQAEGVTSEERVAEPTEEDALATESQANDALMLQHLSRLTGADEVEEDGSPSAMITVYGVSDGEVNDTTVVDVTGHLAQKTPDRDFILILDATQRPAGTGVGEERLIQLGQALETVCEAHGVLVLNSLQELAEHMKKGQVVRVPEEGDTEALRQLRTEMKAGKQAGDTAEDFS